MKNKEHIIQSGIVREIFKHQIKYPELSLLHSIPNGGYRPMAVAVKLKLEGVKPGIPDMFLPVSRGGYHGLYIEVKSPIGRLSKYQEMWSIELKKQNYAWNLVRSSEEGVKIILSYYLQGDL